VDERGEPTRSRTRWLTTSVLGFGVASFLSDARGSHGRIIEGVCDGLSTKQIEAVEVFLP
jgi:hypothetical protein